MEAKDLHKPPLATAAMTQAKPAPAKATTAPTGAVPSNGAANAKDPISRLRVRRAKAMEGGGAARIQAQHDKGKYTARERVDLLCDPGTFVEIDAFVRTQATSFGMDKTRFDGDGVVTGYGYVNGRLIYLYSQ